MPRDLLEAAPGKRKPRDLFEENASWLADLPRSVSTGVRQGMESAAAFAGDVNNAFGQAAAWAAGKAGASPETQETVSNVVRRASPFLFQPTTEELREKTVQAFGDYYEPQTTIGEYGRTVGQFLPGMFMGGPLGGSLKTAGKELGRRALSQVLLPALGSETAGQATRDMEIKGVPVEPYARLAGGVAGATVPAVASRIVAPLPISRERVALVNTLKREGVPITAGQKTGSEKLKYAEAVLGGKKYQGMMEKQGEALTKAALSKSGVNANRATAEVMDDAFRAIGDKFDDLAARTNMPLDTQLQDDMLRIVDDYQSVTGTPAPAIEGIMNSVAETARKNGGRIAGEAYKNIRSRIGKLIKSADPQAKQSLREMQTVLDDAVGRHMPAEYLDEWKEVRRQYKNLLPVEKAMQGAAESTGEGILTPASYRSAVKQQNPRAYVRGQGDHADLARASNTVMKALPQSGTSPREHARNLGMTIAATLGAGGGGVSAGIPGAIAGGAAGFAAPYLAGRALLSSPVQGYLGNQLISSQFDPARSAMVAALLARPQVPVSP